MVGHELHREFLDKSPYHSES